MFRTLSDKEVQEFRQWARDNFDPAKDDINPVWHPEVRQECADMIAELGDELADDDGYILRSVR
jgi:hypothetical protein